MQDFQKNYLLWVVAALVAIVFVKMVFTKSDPATGAISFGMPKFAKKA